MLLSALSWWMTRLPQLKYYSEFPKYSWDERPAMHAFYTLASVYLALQKQSVIHSLFSRIVAVNWY